MEAALGSYFGAAYIFSGYNLFVPILLHSIYDFANIISAWLPASKEVSQSLNIIDSSVRNSPYAVSRSEQFKQSCQHVFNLMDIDKSGSIDKTELMLAQQLIK
jgi:hypothetical protein